MKPAALLWLCVFAWLGLSLHARELTTYHLGDTVDADLTTPVALDVVDASATAALQSARAQQFPAIFRHLPDATNVMTRDFLAAFAQARTNFLTDLTIEFHSATVPEATIQSADFGRLVTVFGVENRNFPISDELAAEWARGGDGQAIREKLLATLRWAANRPVRPDALPPGMAIGETVRLVPVTGITQKLWVETVEHGPVVPAASLMTVANVQALFRREFPAGQQLFAQALAAFLQPNCFPDAPFTQLMRGAAVYKLVVSDHFDAGDVIVRQGDTIDAKMQAALTALNEKLQARPQAPPAAVASPQPPPTPTPPPAATAAATPAPAPAPAVVATSPVLNPPKPASKITMRHLGLILTLAAISALSLLVAAWQSIKDKKGQPTPTAMPVTQVALALTNDAKPALAPQVAQAVREAVQQELAMQRRELLRAQEAATNEITALVHRLDELQVPMQERLQTYEARIQMLEKELALRDEENRELLKLKIEMVTRQLETERATTFTTQMTA